MGTWKAIPAPGSASRPPASLMRSSISRARGLGHQEQDDTALRSEVEAEEGLFRPEAAAPHAGDDGVAGGAGLSRRFHDDIYLIIAYQCNNQL